MFRLCCLVLAMAFMPEPVWSLNSVSHECGTEQPLPESGEETPCHDSKENLEDTVDPYLQSGSAHLVLTGSSGRIDWHTALLHVPENIPDILSPPPRG